MYQYLLDPKAQIEYEESVEFYAEKSKDTTLNFINTVEQSIKQICKKPFGNKKKYKNYYEINLNKFPFTIIYTVEEEIKQIIIISIYHSSRNPKYKINKKI